MDYCFLSREPGARSLTVLVTKDQGSRALIANAVLCKGRAFEDTVDQAVLNARRFWDQGKLLLKTGNEAALVDLKVGVAEKLGLQVVPEAPRAHEPESNGMVENGVQQVKGMVRTLMLALEGRISGTIPIAQAETAYVSLRDSGWPIAIVDKWEEVADPKTRERWWRELSPARQAATKALVANGQLNFVNGGWCMHDEAAAHYVDMIDQTTRGHTYLKEKLGVTPKVGWQIDPFGHSAAQALSLIHI